MTNHDLSRAATEKSKAYKSDDWAAAIADTYAEPMAELERLKRQVAFVKRESLLAIADSFGRHSETECLLCDNEWFVECPPRHAKDCPNNEVAT